MYPAEYIKVRSALFRKAAVRVVWTETGKKEKRPPTDPAEETPEHGTGPEETARRRHGNRTEAKNAAVTGRTDLHPGRVGKSRRIW